LKNNKLTKETIVLDILPDLIEILTNAEKLEFDEEKSKFEMDASLILAYKNQYFKIFSNFRVTKHNRFQASGSGIDYTLGVLNGIKETDNIEEELLKSLKIPSKFVSNVSGPYVFINTKDLTYKIKE